MVVNKSRRIFERFVFFGVWAALFWLTQVCAAQTPVKNPARSRAPVRRSRVSKPNTPPKESSKPVESEPKSVLLAGDYGTVAFGPGGCWLAASGAMLNSATGRVARKTVPGGGVIGISRDGRLLATAGRQFYVQETASGRTLSYVSMNGIDEEFDTPAAFSPEGKWLAFVGKKKYGDQSPSIKVSDALTGSVLRSLPLEANKWVEGIAFSPNGETLAAGISNNYGTRAYIVRLWDAVDGRELATLTGHSEAVKVVAFSPDGGWLASGDVKGVIKLWEVSTRRELATLAGPAKEVEALTFSPDGRWLASGSEDGVVKLWEVSTGRELRSWSAYSATVTGLAFSKDGRLISVGKTDHGLSSWSLLRFWDPSSGSEVGPPACSTEDQAPRGPPAAASATSSSEAPELDRFIITGMKSSNVLAHMQGLFSPDGRKIATWGWDEPVVRIWGAATSALLHTLTHNLPVTVVAWSTNGHTLATASRPPDELGKIQKDTAVKAWDPATGHELGEWTAKDLYIYSLALSPDGGMLAGASEQTVRVWQIPTGAEVFSLAATSETTRSHLGLGVAFSPDGRWLATAEFGDPVIHLWDVATRREVRSLPGHNDGVRSIAFSPDGRWLAAGEASPDNEEIKLWELPSGKFVRRFARSGKRCLIGALGFTTDGNWLLSEIKSIDEGTQSLSIWEVSTGREMRTESYPGDFLAFSPGGVHYATSRGSTLAVWKGAPAEALGAQSERLAVTAAGAPKGCVPGTGANAPLPKPELVLQTGHAANIFAAAFSPDGCWLATRGEDRIVKIWEVATGRETRTLSVPYQYVGGGIRFSPDGHRLVARGSSDRETSVRVWEAGTWRVEKDLDARKIAGELEFSPDGHWLVVAGEIINTFGNSRGVRVWEVATGRELNIREDKLSAGEALAFSPDRRTLATGNIDGVVKLWDLTTGRELSAFGADSKGVGRVAFSPDGKILASAPYYEDGTSVKLWDVAKGQEIRSLPFHSAYEKGLALSPDGRWLAAESKDGVKLWDLHAAADGLTLGMHANKFLVFSPDGSKLIANHDGSLSVFNVGEERPPRNLRNEAAGEAVALSPDARWFASVKGNVASIQELASGLEMRRFAGYSTAPKGTAFSPDGRWLEINNSDQKARVLDVSSGQLVHAIPQGGEVHFSPDSRWMAAGGIGPSSAGATSIWEVSNWQKLGTMTGQFLAFSSDSRWLATFEEEQFTNPRTFRAIRLWDLENRHEGATIDFRPTFAAFAPEGKWLITWTSNAVQLWDVATGNRITPPVTSQIITPDGRWRVTPISLDSRDYVVRDAKTGRPLSLEKQTQGSSIEKASCPKENCLVVVGQDQSLTIRDATSGQDLARVVAMQDTTDWAVVTPDGLFDGTPEGMQRLVAWRFGNETAPLETFFNEFYYPGLLADILAGKQPKPPRDFSEVDRRQPSLQVTLARPQPSTPVIPSRTVTLKLEVAEAPADQQHSSGSGARDVRLFRNGSLVKVWRGDVLDGKGGKATLEATLPIVAGVNRVTAYAFNRDNIKSTDAELVVTGAESLRRQGMAYILAIGVNEYENKDYNLSYAVADAKAFAEELRQQQTKLGTFAGVEIIALHNQDATKANILKAIARLAGKETGALSPHAPPALGNIKLAEAEDTVLIYYAGHGTAAGPRFYLIPNDMGYVGSRTELDETGLKTILEHSISDQDLEQAFEKVDAGHIVLVIDACNSGQALEAEEKRRGPMNSKGLAQLAYEKGMYILTAAQGYQAALEAAQLGHGYLTYALVEEGLKTPAADTAPKDGQVTVREWLDYATLRVPQMQETMMQKARKLGREIAFVEGEQVIKELAKRSLQRPRVFYRREPEAELLIVAKPQANP